MLVDHLIEQLISLGPACCSIHHPLYRFVTVHLFVADPGSHQLNYHWGCKVSAWPKTLLHLSGVRLLHAQHAVVHPIPSPQHVTPPPLYDAC